MSISRTRLLPLLFALGLALIVGACTDFGKFSKSAVDVQVSMFDLVGGKIDGATVELRGDTNYGPVLSGPDGIASLGPVEPGNYTLYVLYPDGQYFERTVPVWGGGDVSIQIEPTAIPLRLVMNGKANPGLNIQLNGYGNDPAIEQNNIGYNNAGRYFTFDFTIPQGASGTYRLMGNIAGPDGVGSTEYFIDGDSLGVVSTTPTGDWQRYWQFTLFPEIELTEGKHTMRVQFVTGGRNFHSFRLVPVNL